MGGRPRLVGELSASPTSSSSGWPLPSTAAIASRTADPARLKDDYVAKGFHLGPGPIQGHPFGLDLPAADEQDLIAFLKTL